uniref:RNA helicase n=1 Tax=Colossoma macropomum TaxID=42526 RepID=A0A2I5YP94_9TELE|nr:vasa protein [Colossoma macropomum]
MDEWDEVQTPVVSNSSFGNSGSSWNSGGQKNSFKSGISDNEGSSWKSGDGDFGLRGGKRGRGSRGGGGGFKSFSSGIDDNSEDNEGSSWNSGGGNGGFRGRGGRGGRGSRGRGGYRNSFNSETDENGNDDGFKSGFGGRGGRGGQGGRGGFRRGGGGDGEGGRGFGRGGGSAMDEEGKGDGVTAGPKVVYVPPPPPEEESSVFAHYETGINFDKYDDILVDVSGSNSPKAIMTFEEAGLCESLSRNVSKSGYVKPTPVQKHGIPIISAGRDLMACAQTGSGKTAAFLLPILQRLMSDGVAASKFSEVQEPEAIIVAPTRELINQIYLEARKFAYGTCVRPVVVYGGINTGYTIREVLKGCNVLCGTPGRLLDIIGRGKVGLSKLRYLVLDEADRMLDMGFEPDMRKLVSSPGMPAKEERQTLMFSATYPEDIQRLAADFLKTDYLFLAVGVVGGACSDVEQHIIQVDQYSKREQLLELLKTTGTERTMVFVETKRSADFIATFLCQEKVPTTSIHGDREQREREKALSDFRSGQCPVLVATSVAARGLDIEHVQHVVNFDMPSSIDEYVHRIGRTGRCGNTGRAVSFFNPESDTPLARSLVKVLAGAQQEVPSWLEEIAFSAHGTTGFNPHGKVFASTDTRKGGSFQKEQAPQPAVQNTSTAADDEEWE